MQWVTQSDNVVVLQSKVKTEQGTCVSYSDEASNLC